MSATPPRAAAAPQEGNQAFVFSTFPIFAFVAAAICLEVSIFAVTAAEICLEVSIFAVLLPRSVWRRQ